MGNVTRKIIKGRGLSRENKFLLRAYDLIFEPEKMIKEKKFLGAKDKEFNKDDLHWLLKATAYLQRTDQSIDQFVDGLGYSKKVKKVIAEGWEALNEVEILFREKWFLDDGRRKKNGKDYIAKGKAILKMPELDTYHKQIEKHYGVLGINTRPRFGKKKTNKQVYKNFEDYIQYIREIKEGGFVSKEEYPDGDFYENKFDCMAVLVANIIQVLAEPTHAEREKIQDALRIKDNSFSEKGKGDRNYFSIDEYIHKAISKKRDSRGVMIFSEPPSKIQLSGHQS